jgi:hypothetical protein
MLDYASNRRNCSMPSAGLEYWCYHLGEYLAGERGQVRCYGHLGEHLAGVRRQVRQYGQIGQYSQLVMLRQNLELAIGIRPRGILLSV